MGGPIVQHIMAQKLIYGVGINDKSTKASSGGKLIKEYMLWADMLRRCYSAQSLIYRPTYQHCSVSDNFKHYSYFYDWCQNQIGFNNDKWQLDKDILLKGNKIYTENLCVFIPQKINLCLTKANSMRGHLPIGVHLHSNGKYRAQCGNLDGTQKHLGLYSNPEDAFSAYKDYKIEVLHRLANIYKNQIDERVYLALLNYNITVTD